MVDLLRGGNNLKRKSKFVFKRIQIYFNKHGNLYTPPKIKNSIYINIVFYKIVHICDFILNSTWVL